jgi:chitinase
LAIGGWNEGSENYSFVAADPAKRANLINSALNLVQTWGFDGFDLDWEYPNQNGGVWADIVGFTLSQQNVPRLIQLYFSKTM